MRANRRTPGKRLCKPVFVSSTVWLVLITGCGVIAAFQAASADQHVWSHGFRLDDKHTLLLEQRHREITIGLAVRSRNVGDTARTRTRDGGGDTVDRFGKMEYLARISAEVLKPSAPNYLRNPGERYRIIIEGLEADPDFRVQLEVDAIAARDAVLAQFKALGAQTRGIQRDALHYAGPYVLQVLNETNLMPAPIPMSIAESRVGRIRFDNPGLQRESIEAGRKLYAGEKTRHTPSGPPREAGNTGAARTGGWAKQP